VSEALASGVRLEALFVTPQFLASGAGRELARAATCPLEEVDAEALASVTDADSPQGALALAEIPRQGVEALPRRAGTYLFLDGVQDPGNLGALARVAEAAGAVGLACSVGSAHPNHPRALRASAGSLLRLPVAHAVDAAAVDAHLRTLTPTWVALVPHGGRVLYEDPLAGTLVLALGAEGPGLSSAVRELAAREVRIPLVNPVESLNVATAAAVVLFELRRRQLTTAA